MEGTAMNISYWTCSEEGYHFHWEGDSPQWEDIHTELDMLEMEGKAAKVGDSYRISHETAVSFSRDERELLTLPPIFPYPLFVGKEGLPQNNSFRLKVNFQKADGTYFMNPEVIGSYIDIRPVCCYMCSEAQYAILKSASSCNAEIGRLKEREKILACSLRYVALIKENAKKIDARLDPFLEKIDVVAPDYLSISVEEDTDGTYYASPVILNADGSPYGEKDASEFGRKFKNGSKAQRSYMGKDRTYYVFDQEQQDGLQQIKEARKLTKEQAKTLVMSPQSVFTGAPFRFDRSEYSDRVIDYGAFIAKNYPYLNGIEGGWLPEEGSGGREDLDGIDELDEPEVTDENVAILKELIENALVNGKSSISYQEKTYKLTSAFIEKVMKYKEQGEGSQEGAFGGRAGKDGETDITDGDEDLTYKLDYEFGGVDGETDITDGDEDGEKPKEDRGNLISEENSESVGYEQANEQRRQKRRKARFQKLGADLSMEQVLSGFKDDVVPFSYQKEGIRWMAQNWKAGYQGVLLADDMGLGKTMQVLGLISGIKNAYGEKDMNSVLVVAPVSLLANWESEFIHFVKEGVFEEIVPLYGNSFRDFKRGHDLRLDFSPVAKNRIVLTSYETLRNYDISFGCIDWSFMVLDEAQKIKNPVTLITNAVKSMKYDFAIAITGTPVENAWVDLWSIMDFVEPGRLRDLKNFCNTYQNQLRKLQGDMAGQEALGKKLEQELQPIFLRRQKTDYLEGLPHKEVIPNPVLMPPVQREAYEKIIAVAKKRKKKDILQVIAMLRDTSLCPYLTSYADSTFENMSVDAFFNMSARLKATFQALVNIKARKEKVLIFVTSRKMQRILKRFLEKAFGISIQPPINGELIGLKRQQIVDAFNQKEGFAILILSAEAGGVGFNITAANHVIHLSRCWNPAKEDQATDRVYRIGQKKEVHVYLPIAQYEGGDSFDVKLDRLLQYKRSLSQSVIFPTADTEVDGQDMYNELVGWNNDMESGSACSTSSYWTIEDTDKVTGDVFERMVAKLYASIPGYAAEETKQTNNYGVDVVVETDQKSRRGLLVRCQQMMGESLPHDSVEAIYSAIPFYEKKLGYHFSGVVVTNALDFTSHDKERAAAAGVKLIARQDLTKLLERYPLEKDLL